MCKLTKRANRYGRTDIPTLIIEKLLTKGEAGIDILMNKFRISCYLETV